MPVIIFISLGKNEEKFKSYYVDKQAMQVTILIKNTNRKMNLHKSKPKELGGHDLDFLFWGNNLSLGVRDSFIFGSL